MEKKKLHRIVGILILIAFVIIILPLVTGRNESPSSQTLSVEAPPFPSNNNMESNQSADAAHAPAMVPQQNTSASNEQPPAVTPPAATVSSAVTTAPVENPPTPAVTPAVTPPAPAPVAVKTSVSASAKQAVKLSATAWAVQMGNFHNHGNAIRLANRLRAAGYKAFTREVISRNGTVSTRVYVGPEHAEASARKLSGNIRDQLSLEGLVIPFKPLAL